MKEEPSSEIEMKFYAELPQSLDTYDDLFSDTDLTANGLSLSKKTAGKTWYSDLSEFGMAHFVDRDEAAELLNRAADGDGADPGFKFPANVVDRVTADGSTPTEEALAVKYVLKRTEFGAADDLAAFAARTASDVAELSGYVALRKTLWKLLAEKSADARETAEAMKLMTASDAEFGRQAGALKSVVDEQRDRLSELDRTIQHRLTLLNDACFYMGNVRSKLKKIKVSARRAAARPVLERLPVNRYVNGYYCAFKDDRNDVLHGEYS